MGCVKLAAVFQADCALILARQVPWEQSCTICGSCGNCKEIVKVKLYEFLPTF